MYGPFLIPWHNIATLAFYLLLILYVCYSGVLYYHWNSYSLEAKATSYTYLAFFGITLPLLAVMAGSLYLI